MNTLRQRGLAAVAAALTLGAFACSKQEHPADRAAVADTETTVAQRRDLTSDYRAAEQALTLAEDSVDNALGPNLAVRIKPLRAAFVAYRKEQCERLKAVFEGGTYGPVAELECLIHLTDSRREFIEQHYDFVDKLRGRGGGSGTANPAGGPVRTP